MLGHCIERIGTPHLDRLAEPLAEQHGLLGEPADQDGRNGEKHQRQRNHPGAFVQMAAGFGIHPLPAVEHKENHPERVQRGDEYAEQHRPVGIGRAGHSGTRCRVRRLDDGVLAEESGEGGKTDQRKGTKQCGDIGDGHVPGESSHLAHVLLVMHGDDDAAGAQKKQGLEEGMGHQMKHPGSIGRHTERHGHIAELGQRGIRHHSLDVVLDQAKQAHEKRCGRTNDQNEGQGGRRQLEQRRHAGHHENAGGYHGRGMDQRRDGRGAFHGVGQPDMQWDLGRFAHGADEQQDPEDIEKRPGAAWPDFHGLASKTRQRGKGFGVVQGSRHPRNAGDAEQEAEIADPVDKKRLEIGVNRRGPLVPEADQQIRHKAYCLPAEKQLEEVIRHDQHEHRERKEGDVRKEPLVARIVVHVSDRVDMHAQGHEGDDRHHQRGQAVHQETDLHPQPVGDRPCVDRLVIGLELPGGVTEQDPGGQGEAQAHAPNGDQVRAGAPDAAAK